MSKIHFLLLVLHPVNHVTLSPSSNLNPPRKIEPFLHRRRRFDEEFNDGDDGGVEFGVFGLMVNAQSLSRTSPLAGAISLMSSLPSVSKPHITVVGFFTDPKHRCFIRCLRRSMHQPPPYRRKNE